MSEVINGAVEQVLPEAVTVLQGQGVPAGRAKREDVECLFDQALEVFAATAAPVGIIRAISRTDFAKVFAGDGRNEPRTPVGDLFHRADDLALFAVTVGPEVCREITKRFESNEFPVGYMLDGIASAATEMMADVVQRSFRDDLVQAGRWHEGTGLLRYSPGYCGWHVGGQRKLFDYLDPGRIGISLRESFLMEPLKSISGVLLAGPREMHDFDDDYDFCSQCATRGCRERIRSLLSEPAHGTLGG
jgi:hypothetical protein